MNIDLIIHILLAVCLVVAALMMFLANLAISELNDVIERLYRRIEMLTDKIGELEDELHKTKKENYNSFSKLILDEARRRFEQQRPNIRVKDDDKPLDFPNGD